MNAQNNSNWRQILDIIRQAGQRELEQRLSALPLAAILPREGEEIRFAEIETRLQAGEYLLEITDSAGEKEFFYMAIL